MSKDGMRQVTYYLNVILAFVVFWLLVFLSIFRIIPSHVCVWLALGFGLSFTWEFTHAVVPGFLYVPGVTGQPLQSALYVLAHTMWDAIIMLAAGTLVIGLKISMRSPCALLAILAFCLGLEVIVELLANGKWWLYAANRVANPTLFSLRGVHFTFWPFCEWIIASLVFWLVVRSLQLS